MSVKKLTETLQASPQRKAAMAREASAKLVTAARQREAFITETDAQVGRVSVAFAKNKYTLSQVQKAASGLKVLAGRVAKEQQAALGHMNTALRLDIPTTKFAAQAEDCAAILGKIALLSATAQATISGAEDGDDLVQLDDSGFVVEPSEDAIDDLPQAPDTAPVAATIAAGEDPDTRDGVDALESLPVDESNKGEGANVSAKTAALPDFLKDKDGDSEDTKSSKKAARKLFADAGFTVGEGELDGKPVGTPEEGTTPLSGNSEPNIPSPVDGSNPGIKTTEGDLNSAPFGTPNESPEVAKTESGEYSAENPSETPPSTTLAGRKASDDIAPAGDVVTDSAPLEDVAPVDDGLGDLDDLGLEDDVLADDSTPADDFSDDEFLQDDSLDIELPAQEGLDEMIGAELLGDDFLMDEDDSVAPTDPTVSASAARTARRMTASRVATASSDSDTLLRQMINSDFS